MCLFNAPKPPDVKPPAPPPTAPPPPPAPKPLPEPQSLEEAFKETRAKVEYGRKKMDATRARAGDMADTLRVPLNTPSGSGGLNV